MSNEGRWKLIQSRDFFKYDKLLEAVGRFAKTPSRAYVYKNLCDELNGWKKKKNANATFSAFNNGDA